MAQDQQSTATESKWVGQVVTSRTIPPRGERKNPFYMAQVLVKTPTGSHVVDMFTDALTQAGDVFALVLDVYRGKLDVRLGARV